MLSEEQINQIKEQLIKQIELTFPEDKKNSIINQVKSMNSEQLEEFLVKNNLVKSSSPGQGIEKPECIFCSIISGEINSYKIDENQHVAAVLEINPISKAHVLILPKEHNSDLKKIPKQAFTLAKKIAKKIKTKLKPKDVEISPSCIMNHCIINVLPIYKNENLKSERYQASQEELLEVQKSLEIKKKTPKIKKPKTEKLSKSEEKLWLPRRIP
ncbi:MAG: HIT domain-containing protein [Candidatus Pacearchaeota archaeon]